MAGDTIGTVVVTAENGRGMEAKNLDKLRRVRHWVRWSDPGARRCPHGRRSRASCRPYSST